MSALCMYLLLACQPIIFGRSYQGSAPWSGLNEVNYDAPHEHHAKDWSYAVESPLGPSNWPIAYPKCGGKYQSPICIVTNDTLHVQRKRPLKLIGLRTLPSAIEVEHEGVSVKFTPKYGDDQQPMLYGGPLKNGYVFEQFHFHWGSKNSQGSEHLLNGKQYPMEIHLVFYNGLYDSFADAKEQVDGLAVVGMLYDVLPGSSELLLNKWTRFLSKVRAPEAEYHVPLYALFSLYNVIGDVDWSYFSYQGSLTTPPCLETVTWIVSTKHLLVSEREMNEFRQLKSPTGGKLVDNFRPPQPIYCRRVFHY